VGAEFTTSGLLNSDTVNAVSLTSPGAASTAGVVGSPYQITPSSAVGTGLGNYTISYVAGILTVNPATLTLSIVGSGGIYHAGPFGALCSVATGLVNGDVATTMISYSSGVPPVNVGSYIATCSTTANPNYTAATGQTTIEIT